LNVARFQLPPLRERREDIPELLAFFLAKYNKKMKVAARFHDAVVDALMRYDFPGNIRELEHMVEQAVAIIQDGIITADDLLPPSSGTMRITASTPPGGVSRSLADAVDSAERASIENALRESDGSRERAAELLQVSPTTLWRKMTRLGITFDG
jgi:two-component system response regulator HydG